MNIPPPIRFNLQMHLMHANQEHPSYIPIEYFKIGPYETLKKVLTFHPCPPTLEWTGADEKPLQSPKLDKHTYLVACREIDKVKEVFAVYTFKQMQMLSSLDGVEWRLLEIPKELEDELRTGEQKIRAKY